MVITIIKRILFAILVLSAVAAAIWFLFLVNEEPPGLRPTPEKMVLYSLDGYKSPQSIKKFEGELFHDWPILGEVEITDPEQRRQIANSLRSAMRSPLAEPYKCFNPRHGLRVTSGQVTIDYIICFECQNVSVRGAPYSGGTTTAEPVRLFNQILTDHAIPLGSFKTR